MKTKNRITELVKQAGAFGISAEQAAKKSDTGVGFAKRHLRMLEDTGIVFYKQGRYIQKDSIETSDCEIVKLATKFGFAKDLETGEESFIPGRFLAGAMPGDIVSIEIIEKGEGNKPTGKVIEIKERANESFVGYVEVIDGRYVVIPTTKNNRIEFEIRTKDTNKVFTGDRVLVAVKDHGIRHDQHKVKILKVYPKSDSPRVASMMVLDENKIETKFSKDVVTEASEIATEHIPSKEIANRMDLRDEIIFTIDGADTKDIDDAISVKKTEDGYILGVHIADVSYYVTPKSFLNDEAYARGTSVYFADTVVPMLPKELSNGICSLNPNVDRLAFSVLMKIGKDFKIKNYKFAKTVIHSTVKGVYSEINDIYDGNISDEVAKKYSKVMGSLKVMKELYEGLEQDMKKRGSPEIDTKESKIIMENDMVKDIKVRERGISEKMIEQFMLSANEATARFAVKEGLPILHRIHEPPNAEKIENLINLLKALGIDTKDVKEGMPAKVLDTLIKNAKGTKHDMLINIQALRTMSKAIYSVDPKGHYGLALEDYAHFTSPIRRYPDLFTHRVLSEFLMGTPVEKIRKRYEKVAKASAEKSTQREIKAMETERRCDDIFKTSFMADKVGQSFSGNVSGIAPHGIYVMLDNTVEGLVVVKDDALKADGPVISYTFPESGITVGMGDRVEVKIEKINVLFGQMDLEMVNKL